MTDLTLGKIIFGYTPRVGLPPQQPVSNDTMEQVQRWGEDVSNDGVGCNFGTLKKSSDFSSVNTFPPNSELWVSIRTVLYETIAVKLLSPFVKNFIIRTMNTFISIIFLREESS